jgi:hypothetical protein
MATEEQFGYSLALEDGDIVLDNGALQQVTGKRNLLQALELRILTPFGSDIFNTSYGLDVKQALTQPGNLHMIKELIKLNLVRTLGTDPRVLDIRDVLFQDDPAYLVRHPDLNQKSIRDDRHRRFWQVDVIIETVDAATATLSVNIGV